MGGTSEWERIANEPADDVLITSYIREAKTCRCLHCMEKLQLIARVRAEQATVTRLGLQVTELQEANTREVLRRREAEAVVNAFRAGMAGASAADRLLNAFDKVTLPKAEEPKS